MAHEKEEQAEYSLNKKLKDLKNESKFKNNKK